MDAAHRGAVAFLDREPAHAHGEAPPRINRQVTSSAGGNGSDGRVLPSAGARQALARASGTSGQPLPGALREALEAHSGRDLESVRIHTGSASHEAAEAVHAAAFTVGKDVHFAAGRYDSVSDAGQRLIAHEVAHTLQESAIPQARLEDAELSAPGDVHERYAEAFAEGFARAPTGHAGMMTPPPAPDARAIFRQQAESSARTSGGSPLARQIEEVWRDTQNTGRVFDLLRAHGPVRDTDVDQVVGRIFAPGSDDLWLAQTLIQHGAEPLWPDSALTDRHRRTANHGRAPEPDNVGATIATTDQGRPVQAFFFPGITNERALILGGVHGSEQGGIEVVEMLLADLRAATRRPHYTVIIVPVLFPDNAARRRREGATPTNRNFPAPGTSLDSATDGSGQPRDAQGRAILSENVAFMRLVERFRPGRICTVHGTNTRESAGVFSDPHSVSRQARGRARAAHPGDPAAAAAAERALQDEAARRTTADESLALRMARGIRDAGHGNAVRGNHLDGRPTREWSGAVPGGTSLGGWGPQDVSEGRGTDRPSMSVITVEVPTNVRSDDLRGNAREARRQELLAFRDVIRDIFLGSNPP
jgi:hypothetical protein